MSVTQSVSAAGDASGVGEIVRAEIGIVSEDVSRLEQQLNAEGRRHAVAQAKLRKLETLRAEFEGDAASSAERMSALRRMIGQRRRALVELEQEIR